MNNSDFGGYATKYGVKCSDGRVIAPEAFKHMDGVTVPLVWQHLHDEPSNILGHALLESRPDGMYAHCFTNDTASGKNAKALVQAGDITFLSIYANELSQKGTNVMHGTIRETSLVLAGANSGARIDNLSFSHSDGSVDKSDEEAIIFAYSPIAMPETELEHSAKSTTVPAPAKVVPPVATPPAEKTVADVFNTFTDDQKNVVYAILASAMEADDEADKTEKPGDMMASAEPKTPAEGETLKHSAKGSPTIMKKNVFEGSTEETPAAANQAKSTGVTPEVFQQIMTDAIKTGSFRNAYLAHADPPPAPAPYGLDHPEYLFPEVRSVTPTPSIISRRMAWVKTVINGTNHSPFSRIKSLAADITADEARARGYVKASMKKEEILKVLRRITTPTTIYHKEKLDRDDIIDIVDLDVVAWMQQQMRVLLDEELARAILIGDGREVDDPDKVDESCIRPILTDDPMYAYHVQLPHSATYVDMIDAMVAAQEFYYGAGNPTLYTTQGLLTNFSLVKTSIGTRLYPTKAELMSAMQVSDIQTVMPMIGRKRVVGTGGSAKTLDLVGIIVNLNDYNIGADKGGQVSMFDFFDIDFNQYKYLMEARCSGALVAPRSAIVVEQEEASA